MQRIKVQIPESTNGVYTIKKIVGSSPNIYEQIMGFPISGKTEPHDEYTFLTKNGIPIMQDTYHEYKEHQPLWDGATGAVLITGLGIGMVNVKLLTMPHVTSVTIVEVSQEVIDMVWPYCEKDERFTLIKENIETWIPPTESRWDYAWFDSWIGEGMSLEEYDYFVREKYAPYCENIGVFVDIED